MEVGDNKERIVDLPIERNRSQHYASQAADQENKEEAEHPQHRRSDDDPSIPHGRQPAEKLNAGWDDDHHAGGGEEADAELGQAGGEHVVNPHAES